MNSIPQFQPFYVGANLAFANFGTFGGLIDEVVYYLDRALSATEARAHYDATSPVAGDPQLMHRFSKDNGRTWSAEDWRSAGREGRYDTRVIWRQQGRARTRIDEIVCPDGTPWRITEFYADIDRGTGA